MTAVRLLDVLLAQLRASQPESNCYLCITSSDPRDVCGEHRERLRAIVQFEQGGSAQQSNKEGGIQT